MEEKKRFHDDAISRLSLHGGGRDGPGHPTGHPPPPRAIRDRTHRHPSQGSQ